MYIQYRAKLALSPDRGRGTGAFIYALSAGENSLAIQSLLNFAMSILKAEGFIRLGVDFESFNPTAYGFWLKYFVPYTHSVVRRIDESAIELYR